MQLLDHGLHVDEGIVIRLQHVVRVVVGDSILKQKVRLVQDGLVVRLLLQEHNVVVLLNLLGDLQQEGSHCSVDCKQAEASHARVSADIQVQLMKILEDLNT